MCQSVSQKCRKACLFSKPYRNLSLQHSALIAASQEVTSRWRFYIAVDPCSTQSLSSADQWAQGFTRTIWTLQDEPVTFVLWSSSSLLHINPFHQTTVEKKVSPDPGPDQTGTSDRGSVTGTRSRTDPESVVTGSDSRSWIKTSDWEFLCFPVKAETCVCLQPEGTVDSRHQDGRPWTAVEDRPQQTQRCRDF